MNQINLKNLLFLPLMICFYGTTAAQWEAEVRHIVSENYLFPQEAPPVYVLGDGVALRERPGVAGRLIARLPIASPLYLLEQSETPDVISGISSHWYRVECKWGNGWVWGGMLAQLAMGSQTNAGVKFLGGYDHVIPPDSVRPRQYFYQVRAVRNGRELDKMVLPSFSWDINSLANLGPMALPGVSDVLTVHVPCTGGCGCATGDYVIFWDGEKLHKVLTLKGTPDGEFSSGLRAIFPANMDGEPDRVITKYSGYIQDPENGELVKRFVKTEKYRWDGSRLVVVKGESEYQEFNSEK